MDIIGMVYVIAIIIVATICLDRIIDAGIVCMFLALIASPILVVDPFLLATLIVGACRDDGLKELPAWVNFILWAPTVFLIGFFIYAECAGL